MRPGRTSCMDRRTFLAAAGGSGLAALAGCVDGTASGNETGGEQPGGNAATISFAVVPLGSNRPVPAKYACTGRNVSPEVEVVEAGSPADSLALTLVDVDAGGVLHWSVWDVSPDLLSLPPSLPSEPEVRLADVAPAEDLDETVYQGENFRGEVGYYGPCPPEGERHSYLFTLYGLDEPVGLEGGASPEAFRGAIEGHVVGKTSVHAFFER